MIKLFNNSHHIIFHAPYIINLTRESCVSDHFQISERGLYSIFKNFYFIISINNIIKKW